MSTTTAVRPNTATNDPRVGTVDLKLEVVTIPVSDVDRAQAFYRASAGGSTPISERATTAWSSSRRRAPSARFTSART